MYPFVNRDDVPWLNLSPELSDEIAAALAKGERHPLATRDEDVVRRVDTDHDRATVVRTAFGRDVDKIVNIPAYARYTDKTQVFSFTDNDDLTRRGLHVQLVGRIARNVGRVLGLNCELIEAIALGHDLGHTPFGHAGEHFLKKVHFEHTGRYFNHNVHSVRVIDRIFSRNVSLQTLDGVLCHNGEFAVQKLARDERTTFAELDALVEECCVDEQRIGTLRPATLEGCVVRVCDMIAYLGKDRQDALDARIIDSLDVFDSDYIGVTNAQIINNLTVDLIENSWGRDHIALSPAAFADIKRAKRQNYALIYEKEGVIDGRADAVENMFRDLYVQLLDDVRMQRADSPIFRNAAYLETKSRDSQATSLVASDPHQAVVDYLASCTDSYFMRLHARLFPDRHAELLRAAAATTRKERP